MVNHYSHCVGFAYCVMDDYSPNSCRAQEFGSDFVSPGGKQTVSVMTTEDNLIHNATVLWLECENLNPLNKTSPSNLTCRARGPPLPAPITIALRPMLGFRNQKTPTDFFLASPKTRRKFSPPILPISSRKRDSRSVDARKTRRLPENWPRGYVP